jgi:hypothetical protein
MGSNVPTGLNDRTTKSIEQAQLPPNQAIRSLQEFYAIKGFEPASELAASR